MYTRLSIGISIVFLFLLASPASAATATYTNTSSSIEVSDNFSISDLDVTLNLDADIRALEVRLINPTGEVVSLYTNHRAFGTRFRNTTFDDEASTSLSGSNSSRESRFTPNQPLSDLDGTNAEGTWVLEVKYDETYNPSLPLVLHSWAMTFDGADPATINGVKYHDQNGNGERDDGEPGLEGWTIHLDVNGSNFPDAGEPTTVTDSDGNYEFTDLNIQDYVVREFLQPDWFQVTPKGNRHEVRVHTGETVSNIDFGSLQSAETTLHPYTSTTAAPFEDDGETVKAQAPITVSDAFNVVDVNVIINADAPLFDTNFFLIGPDGTRVRLFRAGGTGIRGGDQFRNTKFDDQATRDIPSGDRPPFSNTYRARETLSILNRDSAAGEWILEAVDVDKGNGTEGQIHGWTLELSTPTQQEPEPIVIVPGMLASISPVGTFTENISNFWIFTPGAHGFYKSLLDQLAVAGYKENKHVFVAHYNWRKPVSDNATTYLKPMIDFVKQETGSDKVDVVAHSMGGLVARSYIQGEQYENDIDQLITLGAPHQGAADAYVAWEGGDFPVTWSSSLKGLINFVEFSLRKSTRQNLPKPLSFRTFFPSLKDLLPITDFITIDENDVPTESLTEQNNLLKDLQSNINDIEGRGVDVTAIIGTDIKTLANIELSNTRTALDEALQRWRDGRPVHEVILPNSTEGDQRVLISSAQIGDNILTIPGGAHEELPHLARKEILGILGIDLVEFNYEPPEINSIFGVAILSPIDPEIKCGDQVLSRDENTFTNAQYIFDPNALDAPKILTISNPPEGNCEITLNGTGLGEYHAITCFADEDEESCTVREGTTATGAVETYSVAITEEGFKASPTDITVLTEELLRSTSHLLRTRHIHRRATSSLLVPASAMRLYAKLYDKRTENRGFDDFIAKHYYSRLQQSFKRFSRELEKQVNNGRLDETAILKLVTVEQQLKDAGL